MANIANIVIDDAQVAPVAHTFAPAKTATDMAVWEDRSASQYIGFNKLTMSMRRPTGNPATGNRNIKLMIKLETPKLENVTNSTVTGIAPAPTVSYRPVGELIITLPERCSLQDRKDLQKYWVGLLANPFVTSMFEDFELAY
jgi:hypothetical protein